MSKNVIVNYNTGSISLSLEEAEKQGLIADSIEARIQFLEAVKNQTLEIEVMQKQLNTLKNTAHKKGLFARNDFYKKSTTVFDGESMQYLRTQTMAKSLDKKLNKKNGNVKKVKI